jgi:hypothetical protein
MLRNGTPSQSSFTWSTIHSTITLRRHGRPIRRAYSTVSSPNSKKSHCDWAGKEESIFWYGRGEWTFEGKFSIGNLTELDVAALHKSRDGQFSLEKQSARRDLFGSPVHNSAPGGGNTATRKLVQTSRILLPASPAGSLGVEMMKKKNKISRLESWLVDPEQEKKEKFLTDYCKLLEAILHQTLIHVHDIHPPRRTLWKDIFTVGCSQTPAACFKCRVCRMRFSQAAIALVAAAQGAKDSVVLP